MTMHAAKKVIIITEKLITQAVAKTAEACGAHGYTITAAGGKGDRGMRSQDRATISDELANVKIEIIVNDAEMAKTIARRVAREHLTNYAGIVYIQDAEVLRPEKF